VGKSSVTANLAVALAGRGMTVGLIDADIWGFSIPRMLGIDGRLQAAAEDGDDGKDSDAKISPHRIQVPSTLHDGPGGAVEAVSMGFLVDDESVALMWRGLMLQRAVQHFLEDVAWGELDYLLVDLPPGTGDVQMGLARLLPRAEMLVVTRRHCRQPGGPARGVDGPQQLPAGDRRRREPVELCGARRLQPRDLRLWGRRVSRP
jgi:ATP-binding protein involved in chromosome partitioning